MDRDKEGSMSLPTKKKENSKCRWFAFENVILPEECLFLRITCSANARVCTQGLLAILILHIYIIVDINIIYTFCTENGASYKENL